MIQPADPEKRTEFARAREEARSRSLAAMGRIFPARKQPTTQPEGAAEAKSAVTAGVLLQAASLRPHLKNELEAAVEASATPRATKEQRALAAAANVVTEAAKPKTREDAVAQIVERWKGYDDARLDAIPSSDWYWNYDDRQRGLIDEALVEIADSRGRLKGKVDLDSLDYADVDDPDYWWDDE